MIRRASPAQEASPRPADPRIVPIRRQTIAVQIRALLRKDPLTVDQLVSPRTREQMAKDQAALFGADTKARAAAR